MGWYADTQWELRFNSLTAMADALVALRADSMFDINQDTTVETLAIELIEQFGEETGDNRFAVDGSDIDPLEVSGFTAGKCYLDPDHCTALAPYVTGTIDMVGDGAQYWRYRFRDGAWTQHDGDVTYPTDEQPFKVWTCRVIDRENEEDTVTVHSTEEGCWSSLRDNYDPEGLSDEEPPVAIVAYLEEHQGLRIDIDVHEVSLSE